MAGSTGKKASSSNRRSTGTRSGSTKKKTTKSQAGQDSVLFHEIGLIILFVAMVILFCCNFGIIGPVGDAISGFLFGVLGLTAYAAPVLIFLAAAFWFANEGNPNAVRKLSAGIVLFVMLGVVADLITGTTETSGGYSLSAIYETCRDFKAGGGIIAGSIRYFLQHYLETIGTVLVVLLCSVVSLILLTEKSLLESVRKGGSRMRELSREDAERRREYMRARREEQEASRSRREEDRRLREEERRQREEERRLRAEEKENERILRMEKKVSGVMLDTSLARHDDTRRRDDIHEIILEEELQEALPEEYSEPEEAVFVPDFDRIQIRSMHQVTLQEVPGQEGEFLEEYPQEDFGPEEYPEQEAFAVWDEDSGRNGESAAVQKEPPEPEGGEAGFSVEELAGQSIRIHKEDIIEKATAAAETAERTDGEEASGADRIRSFSGSGSVGSNTGAAAGPVNGPGGGSTQNKAGASTGQAQQLKTQAAEQEPEQKKVPPKYQFPPIKLLQMGEPVSGDSTRELKETAMRLQQTLSTFGVKVTITDISQGPSVTRYELQPEQGVKVSKIVGLADDIKLNLAATDIRIEAPIPGKAAIGIEVPNKENRPVALRDLLESREFVEFPSNIAFAVGKDIAGKVVVTDIAKMPHMLIAGATGSGKSVCINTLIMSILYKARPEDVKLIMIDPKVVELSVYNGIPHLLVPVVTDPKKASAALHWGVTEMEDRYKKFADFNVRDLKGYNKKVDSMREGGDETAPARLPQIVIIVDELADLMMVCPGEVEESICRLAQLARAAGIHLIIATQRPSVDVITGLIKANMPSRAAFSVSSGVDSRTILDMNGAEKLLGKGDMLFYPQGYSKPARIQGAFVSDKEVSDVVDFLKNQALGNTYAEDIEEKIKSMGSSSGGGVEGAESELDELFEKAGRFIIEKDKASIGMLQRALKIGFNRAARIMDQLCEYGVVGEEEGTKPRKILMGPEQFEQLIEESL